MERADISMSEDAYTNKGLQGFQQEIAALEKRIERLHSKAKDLREAAAGDDRGSEAPEASAPELSGPVQGGASNTFSRTSWDSSDSETLFLENTAPDGGLPLLVFTQNGHALVAETTGTNPAVAVRV
jgi:hypothetical protein